MKGEILEAEGYKKEKTRQGNGREKKVGVQVKLRMYESVKRELMLLCKREKKKELVMMAHAYSLSTWDGEAGRSEVQSHPSLYSKYWLRQSHEKETIRTIENILRNKNLKKERKGKKKERKKNRRRKRHILKRNKKVA